MTMSQHLIQLLNEAEIQTAFGKPVPKLVVEVGARVVNDDGFIFGSLLTERQCFHPQSDSLRIFEYELGCQEECSGKSFDKIVFRLGGKTHDDIRSAVQSLFYTFDNVLYSEPGINEYSLQESLNIKAIRDFIEKTLESLKNDVDAFFLECYTKPIIRAPQAFELF